MVILPIKIISICPIDAQLFVPGPQRGMEDPVRHRGFGSGSSGVLRAAGDGKRTDVV